MKAILDILENTPINKLSEIDPKLAGLVLRAISDDTDIGGQRPIVMVGQYDYPQLVNAGWTHENMVCCGYARWSKPNETL